MTTVDPHLTILLDDFVRLCPGDAPLEEEDWTGLYEICLFLHDQAIPYTASSLRGYLLEWMLSAQGDVCCSPGRPFSSYPHIARPTEPVIGQTACKQRTLGDRGGRMKRADEIRTGHRLDTITHYPLKVFPDATSMSHQGNGGGLSPDVCSAALEATHLLPDA